MSIISILNTWLCVAFLCFPKIRKHLALLPLQRVLWLQIPRLKVHEHSACMQLSACLGSFSWPSSLGRGIQDMPACEGKGEMGGKHASTTCMQASPQSRGMEDADFDCCMLAMQCYATISLRSLETESKRFRKDSFYERTLRKFSQIPWSTGCGLRLGPGFPSVFN
jgi:hypothetical protein